MCRQPGGDFITHSSDDVRTSILRQMIYYFLQVKMILVKINYMQFININSVPQHYMTLMYTRRTAIIY